MKFAPVSLIVLGLVAVASAVPSGFRGKATRVVDRSISPSLNTNAKRLAAGLLPLPARKLWSPTDSTPRPLVVPERKCARIECNMVYIRC